ncbi:MAG: nucleotide sugar dehydrogenase, partial [Pseudomonadota bacterium]
MMNLRANTVAEPARTGRIEDNNVEIRSEADWTAAAKPRLVADDPAPLPDPETCRVAVVGLGYVGLPLICGFSKNSRAIGIDIDRQKIAELNDGKDRTGEVTDEELQSADALFTTDPAELKEADAILVCVPTPVNSRNRPDYKPLLAASKTIGTHMKRGAVVVYESTVDPGTTEDKCLPILEAASGLKADHDFHLGYSPERINPADPTRKLADIKKIVAGSTPDVTDFLAQMYSRVVNAGLFPAANIRVAEAAKILENTQRDVNIALMNELMALYDKMGIRASDVIAAAGSKWNFHNYRPGMVGGHCIAVDPYYLVDAGRRHGLSMELVAAGRSVNEQTAYFIAEKLEQCFEAAGDSRKYC